MHEYPRECLHGCPPMTTHQFFIKRSQIDSDGIVTLDGPDARHIRLVLRLKRHSKIRLVDEEQNLHMATVEKVAGSKILARIVKSDEKAPASARLTVVQGIPKLPKADTIMQKLTELGVGKIVFVPAERSPYADACDRLSGRLDRLKKIAEAAAKQCSRRDIPGIAVCAGLKAAARSLAPGTILLVADEKTGGGTLRERLQGTGEKSPVAVFIGPEGGFSGREARLLENEGAASFSLGRNILRTETAAIVAASIILYEMGDI